MWRTSEVEFDADGVTLRGELRTRSDGTPRPIIILTHGFSGVKEFCTPFARAFEETGFATLCYDHRNFGESGGEPRQEVEPWKQASDYSHAITCVSALEAVDAQRVGVWGSSLAGGHVLYAAANDPRIKCVVSQVPVVSGYGTMRRKVRPDRIADLWSLFSADRSGRQAGKAPMTIPVTAQDPAAAVASPGVACWAFLSESSKDAPSWRNEVTIRSIENLWAYEPQAFVGRIGPTPLLMIVATDDEDCPTDEVLAAYNHALHPKELCLVQGTHYDVYSGQGLATATAAATAWFRAKLGSPTPAEMLA